MLRRIIAAAPPVRMRTGALLRWPGTGACDSHFWLDARKHNVKSNAIQLVRWPMRKWCILCAYLGQCMEEALCCLTLCAFAICFPVLVIFDNRSATKRKELESKIVRPCSWCEPRVGATNCVRKLITGRRHMYPNTRTLTGASTHFATRLTLNNGIVTHKEGLVCTRVTHV